MNFLKRLVDYFLVFIMLLITCGLVLLIGFLMIILFVSFITGTFFTYGFPALILLFVLFVFFIELAIKEM